MSVHHRKLSTGQWARLRAFVLHRDQYRCQKCGKLGKNLECDHVIPLVDGGTNDPSNLQALCTDCHMDKTWNENNKLPPEMREWYKRLRMSPQKKAREARLQKFEMEMQDAET